MKENFRIIILVLMFASMGGSAIDLYNNQGQENQNQYHRRSHHKHKPISNHSDLPYKNYETIMTEEKGVFDLMQKYMDDEVAKKVLAQVP